VIDGPFARLTPQYFRSDIRPHCLTRAFSNGKVSGDEAVFGHLVGKKYGPKAMRYLSQAHDYNEFREFMEDVPHLAIPMGINGDMRSFSSPNGAYCCPNVVLRR
jgi:tyrosinase